jgi:hypothetical protein
LYFAHTATAVDGNRLTASFWRLGSSQQGSDSERLGIVGVILNILQSESEARTNRGVGIIRIDGRQEFD